MAFIEVYLPNGQVEHFELNKNSMTMGRSPQADITIHSEIISRQHAKLKKTSHSRWIIEDAGSRNKTYFNNKPIKSHLLNNEDVIRFGSIKVVFRDPTGKSDEKLDQTIYLDVETPAQKPSGNVCPACKAPMEEYAVVCVKCGFNKKLGKRLKVVLEETVDTQAVTADTAPRAINLTPGTSPSVDKKLIKPAKPLITPEQKQQFVDYILPISFIVLMAVLSGVRGSVGLVILNLIGIVFRTIFMLIAMAIAAKIGEFGFGEFKTAILKVIGICACLTIFTLLSPFLSFIFSIFILAGLLKLSFDLDFFELFLIVAVMVVLNSFVMSFIMAALGSMMMGPK